MAEEPENIPLGIICFSSVHLVINFEVFLRSVHPPLSFLIPAKILANFSRLSESGERHEAELEAAAHLHHP